MTDQPFLSIILPAHNEEHRLPPSLEQLSQFLSAQPYAAEVIVVENGSQDRTYEVACAFTDRLPGLRVIREVQRGKGLAVRRGMLEARGAYRFFCDVDFSMPVEQINRFIPPALPDVDIAIASREAPGAVRYHEPELRHFIGRGFNALVRLMALPGLQDTQCGFKCFRAEVAERVFPLQTIHGWTFDVEVLFIARLLGYRIIEVPIPWYYNAESKVRVFSDSWHMFTDLVTIRRNARQGMYQDAPPRPR
ncbi:glycosyltransferase [Anaerolinea thermolimosa]|uniref:dolichyl-phosphate beta-glucosyltransferase n=1 Tax=Anaerolinea thermolimosa TaxID=229919 RepID=UPI00191C794C|nr:dolichyl-phosphate beta-glucosyltransferase [Anaerolinea thermolimosa]GAP08212.1 glycosyltransferase [Anaerolinea thermolimosa]